MTAQRDAKTEPDPWLDETRRQAIDDAYHRLKVSGQLEAINDHRALCYQINERPTTALGLFA